MLGAFCVLGQCPALRRSVPIRHQKRYCPCLISDRIFVEDVARLALVTDRQDLNVQGICSLHPWHVQRHGPCVLKIPGSLRVFTFNVSIRYSASDGRITCVMWTLQIRPVLPNYGSHRQTSQLCFWSHHQDAVHCPSPSSFMLSG